ncbi:glycoside hydrolase family 16 protein [Siphonobacter aquaeclarae]|uniref:Glycosyl hydrolases family 16 n=1 Tax=Siphonobacter aquaeclarae TaxID=563176 RepID=A0A1G9HHZ2_9BACT|nr:glycoside hydrolase family 16 protein [Siphonobacter aquaeclarae]SDL12515.1 Glycosyl hydrolases family 16 [Siphonobacter aquaeclarae]
MTRLLLFFLLIPACLYAQKPSARKLVWSDEFDGNGRPDPSKWTYEKGFVRNKEPQYYTVDRTENARVENGMLVIEARKETDFSDGEQIPYTSASLITLGKHAWKYGRFEVRAKVPKGLGSWPAIWMKGANYPGTKWPFCGEIDIMEFVGKDSSLVYGTVHYADSTGKYRMEGKKPSVGAPYDDFHVYALEWSEDHMDFYYDDLKYFTYELKKADNRTAGNPFQKEFFLMLNLALGNPKNLGGRLDDRILPVRFYVDYVRIYQ